MTTMDFWGCLMRRSAVLLLVASVIVVPAATVVSAQNLLVNPDFDTDVSGWAGLGVWDPVDAFGSPTSGSATWINTWAGGGAHYFLQCIEVPIFFEGFDLSAYTNIPSGQASTGESYLVVIFYSDPDCTDLIDAHSTSSYTGLDTWHLLTLSGWSPDGFGSVKIGLANHKDQAGDFQIFHDAVFFGPNPDAVFSDDFESADVSGWDGAVGYP